MYFGRLKSLLVAAFSLFLLINSAPAFAQHDTPDHGQPTAHAADTAKPKLFDAKEVIFGHIMDAHEFHFLSYGPKDHKKHVTIPLPVMLYSPQRVFTMFSSSKFHHGHDPRVVGSGRP